MEYKGFAGGMLPTTEDPEIVSIPMSPLERELSRRNQAVLGALGKVVFAGARSRRDATLEELEESGLPSSGQMMYDEIFKQLKE